MKKKAKERYYDKLGRQIEKHIQKRLFVLPVQIRQDMSYLIQFFHSQNDPENAVRSPHTAIISSNVSL